MGRAKECNLTIPSQRVSRRHSQLRWEENGVWIEDLGSQNGTVVNGKRIREPHALKSGDEIEIGPFLCTYRFVKPGVSTDANRISDSGALTQPMLAETLAGRLDQIEMPELLQTLEFNTKTGTLEIYGTDGEGQIVIEKGVPTYAETETQKGEEAVYELVRFSSGQFSFSPEVPEYERNVHKPMGGLLMEACRRLDEGPAETATGPLEESSGIETVDEDFEDDDLETVLNTPTPETEPEEPAES